MGAVLSSIGSCLTGIVNAIGSMIHAIVAGIVRIFDVLISCITCGKQQPSFLECLALE